MKSLATPSSKTGAEFLDEMGDTLRIKAAADGGAFILNPDSDLRFRNDQAPAIALAILKAAGFVPSGNNEPSGFKACVETAAGHLDDAVLIAAGAAAQADLTRRRDQLAVELVAIGATYADVIPAIQNAIHIIIRIQDEATK